MRLTRMILLAGLLAGWPWAELHAQYTGGSGDGHSLLKSRDMTLNGLVIDFTAKYRGGRGGGYSLIGVSNVTLDGRAVDFQAKYRGGNGQGYVSLVSDTCIVMAIEVITDFESVPQTLMLHQNYPNPFNPETRIRFDLPVTAGRSARIRVSISNIRGQVVRVLLDEERSPGFYEIDWDGRDRNGIPLPSGIYLLTIRLGEVEATRKMLLVR